MLHNMTLIPTEEIEKKLNTEEYLRYLHCSEIFQKMERMFNEMGFEISRIYSDVYISTYFEQLEVENLESTMKELDGFENQKPVLDVSFIFVPMSKRKRIEYEISGLFWLHIEEILSFEETINSTTWCLTKVDAKEEEGTYYGTIKNLLRKIKRGVYRWPKSEDEIIIVD